LLSSITPTVSSTTNYVSQTPLVETINQFTPFNNQPLIYNNSTGNHIESSNKNLSSLVDIVNSIGDENCNNAEIPISKVADIPIQEQPFVQLPVVTANFKSADIKKKKKIKAEPNDKKKPYMSNSLNDSADSTYCLNCFRIKVDLCTCHISKLALNRLYRNYYTDFVNNAIHFQNNPFHQGSDYNNLALKNRNFQIQPIFFKNDNLWSTKSYSSVRESNSNQFYSYFENENERLIQVL
jgi:hypothetical protein